MRCFGIEMFLNEEFITVGDETEEIEEEIVVWFLRMVILQEMGNEKQR